MNRKTHRAASSAEILSARSGDPEPPRKKLLTESDVWYPCEARGRIHSAKDFPDLVPEREPNPERQARRPLSAKNEMLDEVKIYTDGGCDPNPGPGGYGVVLLHPLKRKETSGGFRRTTNNRMEIFAAVRALELLKKRCLVTIYSDSQYLVNAMRSGWAARWKRKNWFTTTGPAANKDLWDKLLALCERHRVSFVWVRGHSGNKENERCDKLSGAALRQPNLPVDTGFEAPTGQSRSTPLDQYFCISTAEGTFSGRTILNPTKVASEKYQTLFGS